MELQQILLMIFTAVIAGATIFYAITTRKLWQATNRNAESSKKLLQYNLLHLPSDPTAQKIMQLVFSEEYTEILKGMSTPGVTDEDIVKGIRDRVADEELKKLIEKGDTEKAVEKARSTYSKDSSKASQFVDVLLSSKKEEDWNEAWGVLKKHKGKNPSNYLSLAYSFYTVGQGNFAIEVAEKGVRIAEDQQDEVTLNKLKNSLAYYYADNGDPKYEKLARQYAQEALTKRSQDPATLDTMGYVKIVYGNTPEEIKKGIYSCEEARRLSAPIEFYLKHISKAAVRLRPPK